MLFCSMATLRQRLLLRGDFRDIARRRGGVRNHRSFAISHLSRRDPRSRPPSAPRRRSCRIPHVVVRACSPPDPRPDRKLKRFTSAVDFLQNFAVVLQQLAPARSITGLLPISASMLHELRYGSNCSAACCRGVPHPLDVQLNAALLLALEQIEGRTAKAGAATVLFDNAIDIVVRPNPRGLGVVSDVLVQPCGRYRSWLRR